MDTIDEVDDITVNRFGQDVLVELIGTDGNGDVAVRSVEFELLDRSAREVTPREEPPPGYEDRIRAVLADAEFTVADADVTVADE